MIEVFKGFNPVTQALLATLFTWGVTALGASMVFFFKTINKRVLNGMLGFASGVMIAASFWSLLSPAIELAEAMGITSWVPALIGFLAVTLHNIPEGLAVGVAFGAVASGIPSASLGGAISLAIGIGLQNFPEGAAVSIPLRREGLSRLKSFYYGQASGIVEPIAGVLGAFFVLRMRSLLPYALAFAAGAMIYVVVEELIPTASDDHDDSGTIGAMIGFATMMVLDVALG
ncbi:hypothetical protein GJ496_011682 [Pomphorhynchus laevis]|nr:hypothetical protein GJ496_011682 [Pomphorhynchus laevis]